LLKSIFALPENYLGTWKPTENRLDLLVHRLHSQPINMQSQVGVLDMASKQTDERDESVTVPLHEEVLEPVIREVHLGEVVIHKRVEESPVATTVDLKREDVSVEHVAIDREIDSVPEPRYEGDTLVIPLVEEVLVTEKRLVLREEVRITRHARTEQTEIRDVLRYETADIEERRASGNSEVTSEQQTPQ
jgi:uncharacterized protein (TIGR02271 family)